MSSRMAVAGLLLVMLGSSGCSLISIDHKTRYRDTEGRFDPQLFDGIADGATSKTWLLAHFGEPFTVDSGFTDKHLRNPAASEVELITWQFARQRQKNTRVFLLFNSRKISEENEYLHVVTENDLVIRSWRDEFENVDVKRVMNALGYARAETLVANKPTPVHMAESGVAPEPPSTAVPITAVEVIDIPVTAAARVEQVDSAATTDAPPAGVSPDPKKSDSVVPAPTKPQSPAADSAKPALSEAVDPKS